MHDEEPRVVRRDVQDKAVHILQQHNETRGGTADAARDDSHLPVLPPAVQ